MKGCSEEEFSKLTGALPEAFELQLKALEYCVLHGIPCHPAVLADFSSESNINSLKKKLEEIDESLSRKLEFEFLIIYPHVAERLKRFKKINF